MSDVITTTASGNEYDLVKALLEAAEYRTDEDAITEVVIRRNKKPLFTVRIHPIGDGELQQARKKATTFMPNPANKKLPPVQKEFKEGLYASWIIYLATVEEDQKDIWGNRSVAERYQLAQPVESIDILLRLGEKDKLLDTVLNISGLDDDEETETLEGHAGN